MSDAKKPGLPMPSITRPPLKTTTSEGATHAPPPMPPSALERKPEASAPAPTPAPAPAAPAAPRPLEEVGKGEGKAKRHGVPRGRFSRARKKAIVSDDLNRERKLTTMLTPQEDEDLWDLAWAEGLMASSFAREVLVNYLERNKARVDAARQLRSQLGLHVSPAPANGSGLAATA